jgi:hypothetical protein
MSDIFLNHATNAVYAYQSYVNCRLWTHYSKFHTLARLLLQGNDAIVSSSIEHDLSEANDCSANLEIIETLQTPKISYRVSKSPQLVSLLILTHPVNNLTIYLKPSHYGCLICVRREKL